MYVGLVKTRDRFDQGNFSRDFTALKGDPNCNVAAENSSGFDILQIFLFSIISYQLHTNKLRLFQVVTECSTNEGIALNLDANYFVLYWF